MDCDSTLFESLCHSSRDQKISWPDLDRAASRALVMAAEVEIAPEAVIRGRGH